MRAPSDAILKILLARLRDEELMMKRLRKIADNEEASLEERVDALEKMGQHLGMFEERVIH
jgi:hypothetical protein